MDFSRRTTIVCLIFFGAFSFIFPPLAQATSNSAAFSQNHQLWDTGSDIQALQKWLNHHGYPVASSGPGSPGQETNAFGRGTFRALVAFQKANGLRSSGFLGPLTRSKLNALPGTANTTVSTLTSAQIQAILSLLQSFGADQTTINNVSAALGEAIATNPNQAPGNGYTPGFGGGGSWGGSSNNATPPTPTSDTTPPTVALTAPSNGATISGSSVTLSATASDNVAVAGVTFKVNGVIIGSEDTSSPYSITWDSTATSSGSKTIVAVARNTSNNYATSSSITVTIDNTPPLISAIATSSASSTSETITWTTDEAATSQINFGATSSYGTASTSAALVTSHSITLSGLTASTTSTTYHYAVVSTDSIGNTATSSDQTFKTISTLTTTTWNSSDLLRTALSNGNLTATQTNTAGDGGVRAVAHHSSGKYYFEIIAGTLQNTNYGTEVGITNGSAAFTTISGNSSGVGVAELNSANGVLYINGSYIVRVVSSYNTANVIRIAVDLDAQLIWVAVNAGNWNASAPANPATGTGGQSFSAITGPYYPVVTLNGNTTDSLTANFGASAYNYTPPIGFGNW